jgi:UDP-N-acetylglucosamine transferase subunit ALG13
VFAQIGCSDCHPSFIPYAEYLDPPEFNRWFARASTIVAHAGMGTILSALRYEKPILVMPRRAALREHRNDHQLATVKRLLELEKINVALDVDQLRSQLTNIDQLRARARTGAYATPGLINAVRELIHYGEFSNNPGLSLPTAGAAAVSPSKVTG